MNNNQRYGGRGGYGHPRAQGSNPNGNIYALTRNIIPINTHNGYNNNIPFPPPPPPPHYTPSNSSIGGRTNGYSNNNYVVTHRVQQQYSVQVSNPTENQHHRQPINNNTVRDPTFPTQQVSPSPPTPPLNNCVEDIQADSLATAVVPYTNGANSSSSDTPASCTTPPEPTFTEVDIENVNIVPRSQLDKVFKMLGKEITKEKAITDAKSKVFDAYVLDNEKLKAENDVLKSQISNVEQEKDNQIRKYGDLIQHEQREAARARQDLFTWRNNAMRLSEQLDSHKGTLADRDKKIESLETQIAEVKRENNGHMQRIRQLEQNEKSNQAEVRGKNNAIEQYKVEMKKKNDDLVKVDLRLKDKMKEMKQLDDEMTTLRKKLNMEILNEKKRVNELETNITDWKNKYTAANEDAEGYKADKEKLEGEKVKLENTVTGQNKSIEKKDKEILKLTEERNSIQLKLEIDKQMLQDQTVKATNLKTEVDNLVERNAHLSAELKTEKATTSKILEEQMAMYLKPTLLNQLIQEKMQTSPLLLVAASVVGQQPQLNSPGCSSPVVSEEVPEPLSAEQDCGVEKLEHGHEDTPEFGRKRKHSGLNGDVRQKDAKISGGSATSIEKREEKVEPGSSQVKVLIQHSLQKYFTHILSLSLIIQTKNA